LLAPRASVCEHLDGAGEHGAELAVDVVEEGGALGLGDEVDAVEGEQEGGAGALGAADRGEGVAQERDLGELEDLGGVEDEDDGVAAGQLAAADQAAEALEVVDAGGVDELDAGGRCSLGVVTRRVPTNSSLPRASFAKGSGSRQRAGAVGGDEEAAELRRRGRSGRRRRWSA
jgi:hypothetical protein